MPKRARERVAAKGQVTAVGQTFDLQLDVRNLSRCGCMVQLSGTMLSEGDRVFLDFEGYSRIACTVIWRQAFHAGISFEEDLPDDVIEIYRDETVLAEIHRSAEARRSPAPAPSVQRIYGAAGELA